MVILYALCYLNEPGRLERNLKWLEHHRKLKAELGYDKIIFVDNCSDIEDLKQLNGEIYDEYGGLIHANPGSDLTIYRFYTHLPRTGVQEIPYCWRSIVYLKKIIRDLNPDKVMTIDTDCYALTPKFTDYLKAQTAGWVTMFCTKYGFPEASIWTLCRDAFPIVLNFPIPSYTHYNNRPMECLLPFTHVNKTDFKGDRYGEVGAPQEPWMDFYCQWNAGLKPLIFNMEAKSE